MFLTVTRDPVELGETREAPDGAAEAGVPAQDEVVAGRDRSLPTPLAQVSAFP